MSRTPPTPVPTARVSHGALLPGGVRLGDRIAAARPASRRWWSSGLGQRGERPRAARSPTRRWPRRPPWRRQPPRRCCARARRWWSARRAGVLVAPRAFGGPSGPTARGLAAGGASHRQPPRRNARAEAPAELQRRDPRPRGERPGGHPEVARALERWARRASGRPRLGPARPGPARTRVPPLIAGVKDGGSRPGARFGRGHAGAPRRPSAPARSAPAPNGRVGGPAGAPARAGRRHGLRPCRGLLNATSTTAGLRRSSAAKPLYRGRRGASRGCAPRGRRTAASSPPVTIDHVLADEGRGVRSLRYLPPPAATTVAVPAVSEPARLTRLRVPSADRARTRRASGNTAGAPPPQLSPRS